jgi:predicted O-methyltransferase YrrM
LPSSIDLVLLDGAKSMYLKVLELLEGHLRPGALVVADNADRSPEYLARVRAAGGGYISVPFADDVELSMKLALTVARQRRGFSPQLPPHRGFNPTQ